jgi:hypothetical protein
LDAWNKLQLEIPPYVPYYAPVIESLDVWSVFYFNLKCI